MFEWLASKEVDSTRADISDHPAPLQLGQSAANGLDGDSEIIGNVIARHWQHDGLLISVERTLPHLDEERTDFLDCGDTTKNEQSRL
jgi:hypothetical protein